MATVGYQSQHHHQLLDPNAQASHHEQQHGQKHRNGKRNVFHPQSLGHWLPENRRLVASWVNKQAEAAKTAMKNRDVLDPSLEVFKQLVQESPALRRLANDMFTEASTHYPTDPEGNCAIKSFDQFLYATNIIIKSGPQWFDKQQPETAMGLIGFPINALLDWPMGTTSGYEFWMVPEVNLAMGSILETWGRFLKSHASVDCLNEQEGWLSQDAQGQLAFKANNVNDDATDYTFPQLFNCDPSAPYYGFGSWDAFFTREFRRGVRPVEAPDNDLVIANSCESAPLQVKKDVKLADMFFLKSQPYSLINMLNADAEMAQQFVGGTVYQAFLSAMSYHRWHAPISGTVTRVERVPGTYYSENWFEGLAGAGAPDPAAPNYSQPYISAVATRAIVYIQADNPKIGLMAIIFIGMAEVSSCEFVVRAGQTIRKGEQIGMFHFGGSSHCMLFRKGVELGFVRSPETWNMDSEKNFAVNSALAVVL